MNHKLPTASYTDSAAIAWRLFCDQRAPFDGFGRPFQLGLRPLGNAPWPIVDQHHARDLAEKADLLSRKPSQVWQAVPGYEAAQAEAYATIFGTPPAQSTEALLAAGKLVQEDLVLMAPTEAGHILAVGHVSFPSAWRLPTKIGKPMAQVHDPVPAFGTGTKTANMIERMFTHLKPEQPVQRLNWSLMQTDALHTPHGHDETIDFAQLWRDLTLRMERQTLHKLPKSKCVLFTIRIFVEPLVGLHQHADPDHWAGFLDQLDSLDADQRAYKGLAHNGLDPQ